MAESQSNLSEPDRRWRGFVCRDSRDPSAAWRQITQADLHDNVTRIRLNDTVPQDVHHRFAIAQALCVQSWHCFEFNVEAWLKAGQCLEVALRFRLGERCRFVDLINRAIAAGVLTLDDGERCHAIRKLRNSIAHDDSEMVHNDGPMMLRATADIINGLFPS